jgi:hypothetical protein
MKYRVWIDYKDGTHKEASGLTYEAGLALRAEWEALGPWEDAGVGLIGPLTE